MVVRHCHALFLGLLLLSTVGKTLQQDSLVLPLKRRDGGLIARGLLRNATLPLHGAVKDYGYFYATLQLGTPARQFAVIVDTGSTITYVPCASCGRNCGPHHKDAAFDPASSSSSAIIGCDSDKCICGRPPCGCSQKGECTYQRTYAEQSSSAGLLVSDQLQLRDGGVEVVFGCETKETGEIYNQEADGILGLGNSEVSLVNQLAGSGVIDDVFALCFGSVEGDGALMLGDVDTAEYDVALQYTALLSSLAHPHYYSVQLDALWVGGQQLPVPPERYEEGYGTVLDSGTTFTYLPSEAFKLFKDAVTNYALEHGLASVKGPDPKFHDICFGGAPHAGHADQSKLEKVFPIFELQFADGVRLRTGPLNYLFMHTGEAGAYCLGVFDNGASGTLLGGISFRNILVQYDRRNRRVGFGAASCQEIGLRHAACPPGTHEEGSSLPSDADCARPPSGAPGHDPLQAAGSRPQADPLKPRAAPEHGLVFAWVALAIFLTAMGGLVVHMRSIWAPAISDLFLSMRYGVTRRGRYGRYRDDPDELGLIRIEAGRGSGAPGKGRALMRQPDLAAPPGSRANAGVFDTLEPRQNGGAGKTGDLHSGSEWSMSDEDTPRGQHGASVGGGTAADAVTFVATFPHGTAAGVPESSSVADAGTLSRPK
ncbi:Aspartic proteinase Asp1 [Coccomyxa sp. Obi]|nr:aspartyl protease family protein [Coccomyxa sp. Obi]BDA43922.1 Aspartic proteinase Asp1 [Coccomyxa sp. Obi]